MNDRKKNQKTDEIMPEADLSQDTNDIKPSRNPLMKKGLIILPWMLAVVFAGTTAAAYSQIHPLEESLETAEAKISGLKSTVQTLKSNYGKSLEKTEHYQKTPSVLADLAQKELDAKYWQAASGLSEIVKENFPNSKEAKAVAKIAEEANKELGTDTTTGAQNTSAALESSKEGPSKEYDLDHFSAAYTYEGLLGFDVRYEGIYARGKVMDPGNQSELIIALNGNYKEPIAVVIEGKTVEDSHGTTRDLSKDPIQQGDEIDVWGTFPGLKLGYKDKAAIPKCTAYYLRVVED